MAFAVNSHHSIKVYVLYISGSVTEQDLFDQMNTLPCSRCRIQPPYNSHVLTTRPLPLQVRKHHRVQTTVNQPYTRWASSRRRTNVIAASRHCGRPTTTGLPQTTPPEIRWCNCIPRRSNNHYHASTASTGLRTHYTVVSHVLLPSYCVI